MEKVQLILKDGEYMECYRKIEEWEQERIFCRHNMVHFLDVARIAYVLNLEEGLNIRKELIYAAAMLHDIGRHLQYLEGIPHDKASAQIAVRILERCGFLEDEQEIIVNAILNHRNFEISGNKNLDGILYRADKRSRACFSCPAEKACDWKNEKKNFEIFY